MGHSVDLGALSKPELENTVKTLQRHGFADAWKAHLAKQKEAGVRISGNDPARAPEEVLKSFLTTLQAPRNSKLKGGGRARSDTSGGPSADRLVPRIVKWAGRIDKERRLGATSSPLLPAPNTPRSSRGRHSSAAPPPVTSTSQSRPMGVWDLVNATRAHPGYMRAYSLPSYLPGWARVKRRVVKPKEGSDGSDATQPKPVLVAVDCEMGKTEDGQLTLIAFSVVDSKGDIMVSSLVKSRERVVDYQTHLTGLREADFEGVTMTRSEARKWVKAALLAPYREHGQIAVLVGHSLHNDLLALRLDHQPVIDTALIFAYKNLPDITPGLRDLHNLLLGQDMSARGSGRHDSVEDARAALALVRHELGKAQRTPPLAAPAAKATPDELRRLLVYGIPAGVTDGQLLDLFLPILPDHLRAAVTPATSAPGDNSTGQASGSTPSSDGSGGTDSDDSDSDTDSDSDDSEEAQQGNEEGSGYAGTERNAAGGRAHARGSQVCLTEAPTFGTEPAISNRRAQLVFKHAGEANAAFNALVGTASKDGQGRACKTVTLSSGARVTIRKAAAHNGYLFHQSDKPLPTRKKQLAPHKRAVKSTAGGSTGKRAGQLGASPAGTASGKKARRGKKTGKQAERAKAGEAVRSKKRAASEGAGSGGEGKADGPAAKKPRQKK